MIASLPACEQFGVPLALNWTICMVSLSISSGIVYSKGSLEIKGMAADSVDIKVLYLARREVVNRRTEGFEEKIVLDKERRWKKKKRYTLISQFKSYVRLTRYVSQANYLVHQATVWLLSYSMHAQRVTEHIAVLVILTLHCIHWDLGAIVCDRISLKHGCWGWFFFLSLLLACFLAFFLCSVFTYSF